MNILILTFSPAGSTFKLSKILQKKLENNKHSVQLINITGSKAIFKENKPLKELAPAVKPHDLIIIGSPVYEKHLEFYVRRFMKQLPKPDKTWGKLAIPFVTYGGISSGMALKESLNIFKKSGRTTIAAMKIESSHIKCGKLKTRVNENMPGDEAIPYIEKITTFINRIDLSQNKIKAITKKQLHCHNFREKIICKLLNERLMHRRKYPQLKVIEDKCTNCSACITACPIQRIETLNNKAFMHETKPECIHCFSCVNSCPNDAITFVTEEQGWADIDRIYGLVSKPDSIIRSKENPKSTVYITTV